MTSAAIFFRLVLLVFEVAFFSLLFFVLFFFGVKSKMRVFAAIAVVALCAGVACAGGQYFEYPYELTRAASYIDRDAGLGHFRAHVLVPPEPKEQADQTVIFFAGAIANPSQYGGDTTRSGLALIWNAEHRWLASVGSVSCTSPYGVDCHYLSVDGWDLKVEPGDLVMLNITNLQRQGMMGYEVSVPSKKVTTGMITEQVLDESKTVGVYAAAAASNVDNLDKFPYSKTLVLNLAYSASVNPSKDIPLTVSYTHLTLPTT